jgi:hypothetical protein
MYIRQARYQFVLVDAAPIVKGYHQWRHFYSLGYKIYYHYKAKRYYNCTYWGTIMLLVTILCSVKFKPDKAGPIKVRIFG